MALDLEDEKTQNLSRCSAVLHLFTSISFLYPLLWFSIHLYTQVSRFIVATFFLTSDCECTHAYAAFIHTDFFCCPTRHVGIYRNGEVNFFFLVDDTELSANLLFILLIKFSSSLHILFL